MSEFILGFMTAAWLFTLAGGAYSVYRYVRQPWIVMRKDVVALNDRINTLGDLIQQYQQEQGLRRAMALDDVGVAQVERRNQMRHVINQMSLEN